MLAKSGTFRTGTDWLLITNEKLEMSNAISAKRYTELILV